MLPPLYCMIAPVIQYMFFCKHNVYKHTEAPVAESVHSALVSAVSKAKISDFTESLAPKSIQKALPTE